ncbi:MAG: redoxin domain-containing protein [Deltaproteobacteria bacterium]|nr:redoxin domain-containing protein [Deltaproteobacteria bacterium]MBW2396086.1 redoxin domain-containing protein [Deltaproteobacteria bacterium]
MRLKLSIALLLMSLSTLAAAERARPEQVERFQLMTASGQSFDSAELEGKLAVISFLRLGQSRSALLVEDLERLHQEFKDDGLQIIAIASGETDRAGVEQLTRDLKVSFPILLDPDRTVYRSLGVIVSPTSLFVDSGTIRFSYPGHWPDFASVARADVEFLLGRISQAEREERVRKKMKRSPKATVRGGPRYRLACRLLAQGKVKEARQQLELAWNAKPRVVAAGVDLALLLLDEGKSQEALELIEQATEISPDDPRVLGARGMLLIRSGAVDAGIGPLQRAIERGVPDPVFYWELARLSEERGNPEDALYYYKAGFRLMLDRLRISAEPVAE